MDKGDFVGRAVLADQRRTTKKKLVAFKMTDKIRATATALSHLEQRRGAKPIGEVVSGTAKAPPSVLEWSRLCSARIGKLGTVIEIEIRGKRALGVVVRNPFIKKVKQQMGQDLRKENFLLASWLLCVKSGKFYELTSSCRFKIREITRMGPRRW